MTLLRGVNPHYLRIDFVLVNNIYSTLYRLYVSYMYSEPALPGRGIEFTTVKEVDMF